MRFDWPYIAEWHECDALQLDFLRIMDDGHVQFLEEGETPCYVKWLEYGALIVVSNNDTTKPGP